MATRAGFGLTGWSFANAAGFWRWVDLCEEGGIDSLWHSDRLVGEAVSPECLSVMAALAGRTRRLKFGMSVLALGWRQPVVVAKACATIDYLSEGRFLPAFGLGALNLPEWEALGLEPEGRGAAMDEALEVIQRLWRGETVDFDGAHVKVRGAQISPLPVQAELPLWIGGSSPAAIRRTARYGTGWLGGLETVEEAGRAVAGIKAAVRETGRKIDVDHYGAGFFFRFAAPGEATPRMNPRIAATAVVGDAEAILHRIRELEAVGVTKLVLRVLADGEDDMLAQTRRFVEEVTPRI